MAKTQAQKPQCEYTPIGKDLAIKLRDDIREYFRRGEDIITFVGRYESNSHVRKIKSSDGGRGYVFVLNPQEGKNCEMIMLRERRKFGKLFRIVRSFSDFENNLCGFSWENN